ncbi:M20/M25/M40 family metallo-hydrolase [Mangrovicoccus ximenensis]|uniref:M20/M25/M40 family metallo-hydrolase n=1 Tax=Mangrovicoccus ximenensis TaxID=1911570 RepID=UPI000D3ADD4E|nr:M20/M25/M40 family metallo-hydrolase [Mangrovicoccus ximenensis]
MTSEELLRGLLGWVEIDTPTGDVAGIARLLDLIEAEARPLGPKVERIAGRDGQGGHLVLRFAGGPGPGVLVTSHIDTVCAPGSVEIRREGDRQFGPGIADMKGGGYLALAAMRSILSAGETLPGPVTLIYNSDEEIGSPTSHRLIQAEARRHGAALIPEPARGDEMITFRKGRGKYSVAVEGRASHAGSAFADGRSAISELARVILRLDALTDLAVEALHAACRTLPQRPGFASARELLTLDDGGDLHLAALPADVAETIRDAWHALTHRRETVIHGDLTPGNLLACPDGRTALIDWDESRRDLALFDLGQIGPVDSREWRAILAWEVACSWAEHPAHAARALKRL